jgi:hypothetical protein
MKSEATLVGGLCIFCVDHKRDVRVWPLADATVSERRGSFWPLADTAAVHLYVRFFGGKADTNTMSPSRQLMTHKRHRRGRVFAAQR